MRKLCLLSTAALLAVVMAIGTVHLIRRPKASTPPAPIAAARPDKPANGVDEQTIADIRSSLEKQEYHISFDEQKKKLQSPNRKNNIRAYYEPGKLTVQTRVDTTGEGFRMELVNEGVFADGKLLYAPEMSAKADHHENKVEISHSAFTEEFINDENGVRQNFIIESAPEGTRHLQVKMAARGLKVAQGVGNELRFYSETRDGQTRNELVYSDLKCWDANKRPLHATLAYVDHRIQVSVDVANAAYPVTIDPIIANGTPQNANKVIQVDQSYMWLGFSVASAGDVNGDGYSDVIVGAPHYDKGQDNEGAAFVYKGHGSGLTLSAVTLECNQAGAEMGRAVSTAGDFNGDGYSDVLVGIPYYDFNNSKDAGLAKLYFGSVQGINGNPALPPRDFISNNTEDYYGISVATAGDVDADGYSDVLIGAHNAEDGQGNEGLVMLYYGASTNYKKLDILQANQANAFFGYSVASAGDIDADGYSDVIVGARYYTNGQGQNAEGAAFIYRGSAIGLLTNPVIIEGNQYDAAMGNQVSSAGDVNGDGYSDILISAYLYDNPGNKDNGIVNLYLGSSSGISAQQAPARTFTGKDNDNLGSAIACAGDVNGDGFSDILIGAKYYDNGQFNEGAVYVYQGSKNGVVGDPVATMESNQGDGWFGTAIASAGDVNGDGYSDIVVGCYTFDNGQTDEGHVFIYHGGPSGLKADVSTTLAFQQNGTQFGASVASAGDVNADGYGDVIVGAPYYDGGQNDEGLVFVFYGSPTGLSINSKTLLEHDQAESHFGNAVAGAGDVNGDGYDDIIAAAVDYTNGQNEEGAVFVHYGSQGGVAIQSAAFFESNVAGANFGRSISGAGDINRDGYADVLIGVPYYTNGQSNEGAIYVYQGSGNGLIAPKILESNQASAFLGGSVSIAGDVNGDGYSDVIGGAKSFAENEPFEGGVYVFHGSQGGAITPAAKILQSNKPYAYMGNAVSAAGDVNGDGFADIVVGASNYDDKGAVIIYFGSSAGITEVSPIPTMLLCTDVYASFGGAVSAAGDVNGDGYSDVIVGAYGLTNSAGQEGKAFVYHGSPLGVKVSPSFDCLGNQTGAYLGTSVSSAGDVNGDGYSDIIVGIPHFNNGANGTDAGGVKVFYGNGTKDGIRNNTRLYNTNGTPFNHSNFNSLTFGVGLFAKSFIGANKGKLVWETQPEGVSFNKGGAAPNMNITTSTQYTNMASVYSTLTGTGSELKNNINKNGSKTQVRVRVKYSPALAITGQVYGPWRYLQPQLTGSSYAPVPEEQPVETQVKKMENPEASTQVRVFPNPVADKLRIETADAGNVRAVKLMNAYGAAVYQSSKAEREIDVSRLAEGVYILTLQKADGTHSSHRVLIKK